MFVPDGSNTFEYNTVMIIVYEYDNAGTVTTQYARKDDVNNVAITKYDYDELGRKWRERSLVDVSGNHDVNDIITF